MADTIKYVNSFYKVGENNPYSKKEFIYNPATGDGLTEYKGYTIYARWDRHAICFDIVKNGVCVNQRAGLNGAKKAIDFITNIEEV